MAVNYFGGLADLGGGFSQGMESAQKMRRLAVMPEVEQTIYEQFASGTPDYNVISGQLARIGGGVLGGGGASSRSLAPKQEAVADQALVERLLQLSNGIVTMKATEAERQEYANLAAQYYSQTGKAWNPRVAGSGGSAGDRRAARIAQGTEIAQKIDLLFEKYNRETDPELKNAIRDEVVALNRQYTDMTGGQQYASPQAIKALEAEDKEGREIGKEVNSIIEKSKNNVEKIAAPFIKVQTAMSAATRSFPEALLGTPGAQTALAKATSQIIEPGLAVLEGEVGMLTGSPEIAAQIAELKNSIEVLRGNISGDLDRVNALASKGGMTPADVRALYRTATSLYRAWDQYASTMTQAEQRFMEQQVNRYDTGRTDIPDLTSITRRNIGIQLEDPNMPVPNSGKVDTGRKLTVEELRAMQGGN